MSGSELCRVIIDPAPNSGAWNMAVDEALLDAAISRDQLTVRWYQWEQATISLGYFQAIDSPDVPADLQNLPMVKRITGGGAILHHHELTYSCAIPASHPLTKSPRKLYAAMHEQIIEVLKRHGIHAAMRGVSEAAKDKEFLCFSRGDPHDVVMQGHKILGSAQRRRKGAVLQHGSLILAASQYTPQFPGASELAQVSIDRREIADELAKATAAVLSATLQSGPLAAVEFELAHRYHDERYSLPAWSREGNHRE